MCFSVFHSADLWGVLFCFFKGYRSRKRQILCYQLPSAGRHRRRVVRADLQACEWLCCRGDDKKVFLRFSAHHRQFPYSSPGRNVSCWRRYFHTMITMTLLFKPVLMHTVFKTLWDLKHSSLQLLSVILCSCRWWPEWWRCTSPAPWSSSVVQTLSQETASAASTSPSAVHTHTHT